VTWRAIGDIFGLSGSTVQKHANFSREAATELRDNQGWRLNETAINTN
jgi:hypothetical protein